MRSILPAFLFACAGGKPAEISNVSPPPPASTPQPAAAPYGGASYAGVHFDHTAELKALGDQIAPLAGPATTNRRTAACAASAKLAAAAKALAHAPRPSGTGELWSGEAAELAAITEDLGPHCTAGNPAEIDFDVDSLHRSFQRLVKLLPKG